MWGWGVFRAGIALYKQRHVCLTDVALVPVLAWLMPVTSVPVIAVQETKGRWIQNIVLRPSIHSPPRPCTILLALPPPALVFGFCDQNDQSDKTYCTLFDNIQSDREIGPSRYVFHCNAVNCISLQLRGALRKRIKIPACSYSAVACIQECLQYCVHNGLTLTIVSLAFSCVFTVHIDGLSTVRHFTSSQARVSQRTVSEALAIRPELNTFWNRRHLSNN